MMGGLVAALTGHLVEKVKLKAYAVAIYAAAAGGLLFALVFALVSLRHWIAVTYHSQYPDLWIALGFLIIAVALLGLGLYLAHRKPKTNPGLDVALLAGPPALRLAARRLSPRTIGVGVVLIACVMVGRRMAARRSM